MSQLRTEPKQSRMFMLLNLHRAPRPALTAQTITFPAISNHRGTDAPFGLGGNGGSGLAVS